MRRDGKLIMCMGCTLKKEWPHSFVNPGYDECLTCWLRSHPNMVVPMQEALIELGDDMPRATRPKMDLLEPERRSFIDLWRLRHGRKI